MDESVVDDVVARSRNFGYLAVYEPLLAFDGASAESYVYTDPDAAMARSRRFVDTLTKKAAVIQGIHAKDLNGRINALDAAGVLGPNMAKACHAIRRSGNAAAHDYVGRSHDALLAVQDCFHLGVWLHNTITGKQEKRPFIPPQLPVSAGASGVLRELRLLLMTYRQRIVEQEEASSEAPSGHTTENTADDLIQQVTTAGETLRDFAEKVAVRADQLASNLDTRLDRDWGASRRPQEELHQNAIKAADITEAEFERLVTIAKEIVAQTAVSSPEHAGSALNIAGAGSSNLVIGGFYGGTFNHGSPQQARGDAR